MVFSEITHTTKIVSAPALNQFAMKQRWPQTDKRKLQAVARKYPVRITPAWAELVETVDDPIGRQCLPAAEELNPASGTPDPLQENDFSPVPCLVHRYPDRVLFLISASCPVYCRFCTRKGRVGSTGQPDRDELEKAVAYIRETPSIRDVLLSGGDPLMLTDRELHYWLGELQSIEHISLIRIGTRVPSTWPQRISQGTARLLSEHKPLYINTHFNHPREISPDAEEALALLADAGIPLANQSVLLAGVNDSAEILRDLFMKLLENRVRPYYLHLMDLTEGTEHFRVSLSRARNIYKQLHGHISGMAVPKMVMDLPGGGGKIPVEASFESHESPERDPRSGHEKYYFYNYRGDVFTYPDCGDPQRFGQKI